NEASCKNCTTSRPSTTCHRSPSTASYRTYGPRDWHMRRSPWQRSRTGGRASSSRVDGSSTNMYICRRNPMLYKRRDQRDRLCVLAVAHEILDLPGVVITDGNASGDYVRFAPAPAGLEIVNRELTFAEYWTDPDPMQYFRKKSAKCAEVLVPDRVDPRYLVTAYAANEDAKQLLQGVVAGLAVRMNRHLFFA